MVPGIKPDKGRPRVTKPIVIAAAGGFGREVAWLIEDINQAEPTWELLGFVDDSTSSLPEGYQVVDSIAGWLNQNRKDVSIVVAIGEPSSRRRVTMLLEQAGARFATLIHPTVRRSRFVTIAPGSMICAGCIFTTNIEIGRHSIVNLDCTIGHDSRLGDYSSLMPGVHVSGEVNLGEGVYVGTGANLINGINVGEWAVIGAGAVVSSDLPAAQICVGVPAKPIKANPRAPVSG